MSLRHLVCALFACCIGASCSPSEPSRQDHASLGEMCGGVAGIECEEDLWCDLEPGLCDGADIAGACVRVPEVCTRDYRPVCGCDGRTYGNDCDRRAARAQLDHPGECPKP